MFDSPHQMTPLIPGNAALGVLLPRAASVIQRARQLAGQAHPRTRQALRELLRSMNSYYSNRIEGQSTHPLNIDRALRRDFSNNPDIAFLQRIALAHICAERDVEVLALTQPPLTAAFAVAAHKAIYEKLDAADRKSKDGRIVEPGALRADNVEVGRHLAPVWDSMAPILVLFDRGYKEQDTSEMALIAAACAHHRLVWIHPFLDGNGRAARLQTHAALFPLTQGLWSINRGLARSVEQYYARLADADQPRQADHDGRGNLTEKGLVAWIAYFLDVCLDQAEFMARMLDLDAMKARIEALVAFRSATEQHMRKEAAIALHYLFAAGPLTRGEFARMTGLGDRVGRYLIAHLLKTQLVASDSPKGPLSFAFPLNALQFLLPGLYPEAAAKEPGAP
jgi:Fic family protein